MEWLLGLPHADEVGQRLGDETLHVPHLLGIEVAQVVRRYVGRGEVRPERGEAAMADLADMDLTRYPHEPLLPAIWRLRHTLTAYDAAYVALAEVLNAPLLTLDTRIAGASGHAAHVEVIG